ncbi:ABC transporter substrate-binding protein [Rhodopila sp.]|uniref:ABC transporter substrate-binding protein n=1 Tax=Rhodopila sp. TaxID=2480087 RepID=UPI002B66662B|nr:extracellular solute-binding protein [Rhodopila sp.]HVZ10071.1 extracellular solute-binding protein [Rhodopila sp.]
MKRRSLLAAAAGLAFAGAARAARPEPQALTPALVDAAKKEGKVAWYTADDLVLATRVSKAFEAKYGLTVQLERSGAERIYQRIAQEYASNISAVDVATTSDVGHTVSWNANDWLQPFIPAEVAQWPDHAIGSDGLYIVDKFTMVTPGYNSRLVKADDAPKSWNDLLDPKWKGKLVKAHPGYSGAITNATLALSRTLGWEFFEKLAKQGVLQVQSATDPPMRTAQGERAVMADGAENTSLRLVGEGAPLVLIYPPEGVPAVAVGSVLMKKAPNPNAARLFMHYLVSQECQDLNVANGARSFNPGVKEPANWVPLGRIKLLFNEPGDLARQAEAVKQQYSKIFGV